MSTTELPSYSGHANRPTWTVSLWLDNDQGLYDGARTLVAESDNAYQAGNALQEYVEEYLAESERAPFEGMTGDLLNWVLSFVDYREIAEGYADSFEPEDRPLWADGAWPECDACSNRFDPAEGVICARCQEEAAELAAIAADATGEP